MRTKISKQTIVEIVKILAMSLSNISKAKNIPLKHKEPKNPKDSRSHLKRLQMNKSENRIYFQLKNIKNIIIEIVITSIF